MIALLMPAAARVDNVGAGGVLTLLFPLVLVFVVAALWLAWWLRYSRRT